MRSRGLSARRCDGRPLEGTIFAVSARDMEEPPPPRPRGLDLPDRLAMLTRVKQQRHGARIRQREADIERIARDEEWQTEQDRIDRLARSEVLAEERRVFEETLAAQLREERRAELERPPLEVEPREPGGGEVGLLLPDGERRIVDRMDAPRLLNLMHRNGRISHTQAWEATIRAQSWRERWIKV